MKIKKLFFTGMIVVFLFPLIAFGQVKSISKKTFETVRNDAESNAYKKIREKISIETNYKAGTVSATTNSTRQYLPPNKSKSLINRKKENIIEKTEEIIIDDVAYKKQNESDWIKRNLNSGIENSTGIATKVEKSESKSKYSLAEVKEGGETFQVYRVSTVDSLGTVNAYYENEYWVKDGLFYKTILKTSFVKPENLIYTLVETYNYNPKDFKIEAPIIKSETKQNPE